MPKGALMSGFENPPRGRRLCPRRRTVDRAAVRADGDYLWKMALRRKVAGNIGIVGLWKCGDYEIMGLWNWVETFSISEFHNFIFP